MPLYEYSCKSCGEKFEVRRSFQEKDKDCECPRCGKRDAQRIYSTFSCGPSCDSCRPAPSRLSFG